MTVETNAEPLPPSPIEIARFSADFRRLAANIETVLRGKPETVRLALICLFPEGHLLIEDKPGVGKTTLAQCLARSIDAAWNRIQFTPDLLPSDVTGTTVFDPRDPSTTFRPGPVFAHLVLADEINRASPKTQSALLEVMQERQVTVDGKGQPMARPFLVVATQNPIDMRGTYPLPEAQLDRFLMRIDLDYPSASAETLVLRDAREGRTGAQIQPVLSREEVGAHMDLTRRVTVATTMDDYIVRLVAATRERPRELRLGASPRGSIALMRAAQVRALAEDRDHVRPEDVQALAVSVLAHRTLLTADAEMQGVDARQVIADVVATVDVPKRLGLAR